MTPLEGASPIITYNRTGAVAGVYSITGTSQVVYLGFPLEAASGMGGTNTRSEFLDQVLGYMYQTDVKEMPSVSLPTKFNLKEPYPNPFNAITTISADLPMPARISVEVIDINGRIIKNLFTGELNAGTHQFNWDAENNSAGVYFVKMTWSEGTITRKVTLLK